MTAGRPARGLRGEAGPGQSTTTTPETTMTTDPIAVLRTAETYLTVTHEHASRHDDLGANFTCGGCALRERIAALLAAPSTPADRITLNRDQLAALLAHHADVLASRWRATEGPGSWVAASTLESHAAELTADEETPAVRELLDSVMAFNAEQQPAETDEERADREETEREHAAGIHTHCGLTCEVELPSEHLRNFVIAKGYPGTKGALDELLRRARAEATASSAATEFELRGTTEIRRTAYRDAADIAVNEASRLYDDVGQKAAAGARAVADRLRRMADEAQQDGQP